MDSEEKKFDWIERWYFDEQDTQVLNRMGTTLTNLGFCILFDAEYTEDVEKGCRCGCCFETRRELFLHVLSDYDGCSIDEVLDV